MANTLLLTVCGGGVIVERESGRLLREYFPSLKIRYIPHSGPTQVVTLYKEYALGDGRNIIIFPRNVLNFVAQANIPHRIISVLPKPIRIHHQETDPRNFLCDDQRILFNHIRPAFDHEYASVCLDLRAGYGKTFIAAALIASIAARTLYIVPTCALAKQVVQNIGAALDSHVSVAHVTGSDGIAKSRADICVAVINSVQGWCANPTAGARPCDLFSLIIFDEVHQYCSPQRLQIFWSLQVPYMFAMTATIGERRDGFDSAIAQHFSEPICADSVSGFTYADNPFKCVVHAVRYYARDEYAQNLRHESTEQVFTHYMIDQFARDEMRTDLITKETRALLDRDHSLFIFAEERAHLESIARALSERGIIHLAPEEGPGVCAVLFYGGITEEMRKLALCDCARVILATYNYAGTGVSITRMTAAILASPRYSGMKQIIGRILRRGSDETKLREVVDIIDQKTCLARQFYLRRNAYEFYGASFKKEIVRCPDS